MTGGIEAAITAMRYSCDPDVEAWLDKWDNARAWDQDKIPMQGWALAAGLDVNRFLGAVVLAIRDYSVTQVKMIAISSHPDVMRARVENAKRPEGVKDREAIDLMLGALPTPKGATFITKQYISGIGGNGKNTLPEMVEGGEEEASGADTLIDADKIDVDLIFPTLGETQKRMAPRERMLPPPVEEESSEEYDLAALEAEIDG